VGVVGVGVALGVDEAAMFHAAVATIPRSGEVIVIEEHHAVAVVVSSGLITGPSGLRFLVSRPTTLLRMKLSGSFSSYVSPFPISSVLSVSIYLPRTKGIGEFESMEPNPDRTDSQIITFKDRYMAEQLMYGATDIPSVGKVEFSWVSAPPALATTAAGAGVVAATGKPTVPKRDRDDDTTMGNSEPDPFATTQKNPNHDRDVDYDVAEVDDTWDIT
jgi:hypothetical protein